MRKFLIIRGLLRVFSKLNVEFCELLLVHLLESSFFFHSVDSMNYVDWFFIVKTTLYSWDKSNLLMMYCFLCLHITGFSLLVFHRGLYKITVYFWLCRGFFAVRRLSLVVTSRVYSSSRRAASRCGGLPCCEAWAGSRVHELQ